MSVQEVRQEPRSLSGIFVWLWIACIPFNWSVRIFRGVLIATTLDWEHKPFLVALDAVLIAVTVLAQAYFAAGMAALGAKDRSAILYLTDFFLIMFLIMQTVIQFVFIRHQFVTAMGYRVPLLLTAHALVFVYVGIEFFIILALARRLRIEDDLGIHRFWLISVLVILLGTWAVVGLDGRL